MTVSDRAGHVTYSKPIAIQHHKYTACYVLTLKWWVTNHKRETCTLTNCQ